MILIHTGDWHLGQTLHGVSRRFEHERFLSFLLQTIEAERADALIVAGDVFDVASPSSDAQAAYYDFLAACRSRFEDLDIVVVGGNHDSPARLDAPRDLLGALGITIVGGWPGDPERAIVPLRARSGDIGAHVIAVPFLRPRDLALEDGGDLRYDEAHRMTIEAHRSLYRRATEAAERRRSRGQALIATGHLYMAEGQVSELSERKIQVGHQHALPEDIFPASLAYVALGHLHRAQRVAGRNHIRYSGSPIPLSLAERTYEHQVVAVELDGERFVGARPIHVPRAVEMLVVPETHRPPQEVLPLLSFLPRDDGSAPETRPFLEVRILLESPSPRLRQDVEAALEGARARLAKIDVRRAERSPVLPEASIDLDALAPIDVFRAAYARQRGADPSPDLIALFRELEDAVARGEAP
jgi:exonuclease SbcD